MLKGGGSDAVVCFLLFFVGILGKSGVFVPLRRWKEMKGKVGKFRDAITMALDVDRKAADVYDFMDIIWMRGYKKAG